MRIKIIVFSNTGNTLAVANGIREELEKNEHSVKLEQISTDGDPQKMGSDIKFKNIPDVEDFDAYIFGSPVWAFSLCPVMKKYLSKIDPLKNKDVVLFITKGLKFHWMGGNNAISQMTKAVRSKDGNVVGSGIVVFKKERPEEKMAEIISSISGYF